MQKEGKGHDDCLIQGGKVSKAMVIWFQEKKNWNFVNLVLIHHFRRKSSDFCFVLVLILLLVRRSLIFLFSF